MQATQMLLLALSLLLVAAPSAQSNSVATTAILAAEYLSGGVLWRESLAVPSYYSLYSNVSSLQGVAVTAFLARRRNAVVGLSDGCSPFSPASPVTGTWIAVVTRGNCRFTDKSKFAFAAGASAVIVVNDVDGEPPIMASGQPTTPDVSRTISIAVSRAAGQRLKDLSDLYEPVVLRITVGDTIKDADPETDLPNVWVLGHVSIFIAFVVICLLTAYCVRSRRTRVMERAVVENNTAIIQRLPTKSFIETQKVDDPNLRPSCAVCLEDFENGEELRVLPCGHELHKLCIDPWLEVNRTCPLCKGDVTVVQEDAKTSTSPRRPAPPSRRTSRHSSLMSITSLLWISRRASTATLANNGNDQEEEDNQLRNVEEGQGLASRAALRNDELNAEDETAVAPNTSRTNHGGLLPAATLGLIREEDSSASASARSPSEQHDNEEFDMDLDIYDAGESYSEGDEEQSHACSSSEQRGSSGDVEAAGATDVEAAGATEGAADDDDASQRRRLSSAMRTQVRMFSFMPQAAAAGSQRQAQHQHQHQRHQHQHQQQRLPSQYPYHRRHTESSI